jgi:hypothetical protein
MGLVQRFRTGSDLKIVDDAAWNVHDTQTMHAVPWTGWAGEKLLGIYARPGSDIRPRASFSTRARAKTLTLGYTPVPYMCYISRTRARIGADFLAQARGSPHIHRYSRTMPCERKIFTAPNSQGRLIPGPSTWQLLKWLAPTWPKAT